MVPTLPPKGTTNSAVAVIVDGQPVMVPNKRGSFTTPSVVSFRVRGTGKSRSDKNTPASSTGTANRRRSAAAGKRRRMPQATNSSSRDLDYDYSDSGGSSSSSSTASTQPAAAQEKGVAGDGGDGDRDGSGGGGLARIYVGEAAVARIATHPKNTYSSVKRIVGRTKKQAKEAGVGLGALNVDQVRKRCRCRSRRFFFFFFRVCTLIHLLVCVPVCVRVDMYVFRQALGLLIELMVCVFVCPYFYGSLVQFLKLNFVSLYVMVWLSSLRVLSFRRTSLHIAWFSDFPTCVPVGPQ